MALAEPVILIHEGPLDIAALAGLSGRDDAGAMLAFIGLVRNMNMGRPVVALDYDCAPALAEASLRDIAAEAMGRWDIRHLTLCHAHGRIAVGRPSVYVGVETPRRDAAYEASRHLIETIKRRVPIWKCEVYADGGQAWLDGTPLPGAMAKGGNGKGRP